MAYLTRFNEVQVARVARTAIGALAETPPRQRHLQAVAFLLVAAGSGPLTVTWRSRSSGTSTIVNLSAIDLAWLGEDSQYERLAKLLCGDDFVLATFEMVAEPHPEGRLAQVVFARETVESGPNRAERRAQRRKRSKRR